MVSSPNRPIVCRGDGRVNALLVEAEVLFAGCGERAEDAGNVNVKVLDGAHYASRLLLLTP